MTPQEVADTLALNQPGAPTPGGGHQPGAYGPGQPGGQGAYTSGGGIPGWSFNNGMWTPLNGGNPYNPQAGTVGAYQDANPNQFYQLASGEAKTRQQMINDLMSAGYNGGVDLNTLAPQALVMLSNSAYNVGQTQKAAQQQQQDQQAAANFAQQQFQEGIRQFNDKQSQALQVAQMQNQTDLTKAQQQYETSLADALKSGLTGPFGPGLLAPLNADLQKLGLPGVSVGGPGVQANSISPAQWDALPDAMKQQLLQAYQAQGGDPKAFLAGIDAQRRAGRGAGAPLARFISPALVGQQQ